MSSRVFIYGLFDGARCLYVGRTRNPRARYSVHKCVLKASPEMRVLKTVSFVNASFEERTMIHRYRALGQAELNVKQTGPLKRWVTFKLEQIDLDRIKAAARQRNISQSAWLIEAAEEKMEAA